MKKPVAIIIDNSEKILESLERDLEKKVKDVSGIEWNIKKYQTCPENINEIKGGDVYFIDFYLPNGLTGDVVARRLKEQGINGSKVLLGGREKENEGISMWSGFRSFFSHKENTEEPKENLVLKEAEAFEREKNWIREGLFQDIMIKPFEKNELEGVIQRLIRKEEIINPISLGVVGLGRFGREVAQRAVEQPWIKSVDIYSQYFSQNDKETYYNHGEVINSDKLKKFHLTPESLLEKNPDLLFIATGVKFNGDKIPDRIKEVKKTLPKVYEIFRAAIETGYENPILCGSNPFEVNLRMGYEMGLNKNQLIGESVTDSIRTRKLLVKGLEKGKYLDKEINNPIGIDIDVIGSHKQPIPLFSSANIYDRHISEFGDYKEFRERFTRWLRGMGKRVMKGADKIGTYSDAPQGTMEILSNIAHMKKRPKSCWTVYDTANENYYFTSLPVNVEYPSLNVTSQKLPEMDAWERKEFKRQKVKNSKLQRKLAGNFINSINN